MMCKTNDTCLFVAGKHEAECLWRGRVRQLLAVLSRFRMYVIHLHATHVTLTHRRCGISSVPHVDHSSFSAQTESAAALT